jgi:hypothetical protein
MSSREYKDAKTFSDAPIPQRRDYGDAKLFYRALIERRKKILNADKCIWKWKGKQYPSEFVGKSTKNGKTVFEIQYRNIVYNVPPEQIVFCN